MTNSKQFYILIHNKSNKQKRKNMEESNTPCCLKCKSPNTKKNGKRIRKHDEIQTYYCNDCAAIFDDEKIEFASRIVASETECESCQNDNIHLNYLGGKRFELVCSDCGHRKQFVMGANATPDPTEDLPSGECTDTEKKLFATKQKLQDQNTFLRKVARTENREFNVLEERYQNLLEIVNDGACFRIHNPNLKKIEEHNLEASGILHLSDLHLNEIVDVQHNTYDFGVASRRLKLFIMKAKRVFLSHGITKVYVVMTGDLINNDKIADKNLNQCYNRTYACRLGAHLISHAILELAHEFQVAVVSVSGNESRVNEERGFSAKVMSNSFDTMTYLILETLFKGVDNVIFQPTRPEETIINIDGVKVLATHGDSTTNTKSGATLVQRLINKHAANGIAVRFCIFGHIHECEIGDNFARSSSMVGSNGYSANGMHVAGRASQNIHIVYKNGSWDSFKMDLQVTDGIEGYEVDEETMIRLSKPYVDQNPVIQIEWKK